MNKVVSLRLDKREIEILENMEKTEKDKSAAARELINNGWKFVILRLYRNGKISTGKAAKELGISISEFIDMLAELGIRSDVTYEDYLESQKTMKKVWK
ncbi:MAG: UPF0175 family protein [Candidatus Aenigmatarchaeota archaeon]